MESGMGLGNTVVMLKQRHRRRAPGPISSGCLRRFVRSSAAMVLEKRGTIKSGSKNKGVLARCQFAQQLKRQLRKGACIAAGGPTYAHGGIRGPLGARWGRGGGGGAGFSTIQNFGLGRGAQEAIKLVRCLPSRNSADGGKANRYLPKKLLHRIVNIIARQATVGIVLLSMALDRCVP